MSIPSTIVIRSLASAFLVFGMPAQADEYNTQTFDIAEVSSALAAIIESYGTMPDGAFYLSGKIYPEGTVRTDGTLPSDSTPVGEWFSHGFLQAGHFASTDVYRFENGQIVTSQAGPFDVSRRTGAITGGHEGFQRRQWRSPPGLHCAGHSTSDLSGDVFLSRELPAADRKEKIAAAQSGHSWIHDTLPNQRLE